MKNLIARLALKGTTLRLVAALTATAALGGCASTISAISIPSNTAWRTFGTGIISPYSDLTVTATGTNISVSLVQSDSGFGPEVRGVVILCDSNVGKYALSASGDPSTLNAEYQLSACLSASPTGATGISSLGVFYAYGISATITDAFTTGGIQVESAANGTVLGIALTKSATAGGPLAITAGVSPVVFAGTWAAQEEKVFFQYSTLTMAPHEPSFSNAALCPDGSLASTTGCPSDAVPVLACSVDVKQFDGADALFISNGTTTPPSYRLTCGAIPITVNINSSYTSLGACVDANIKRVCTGQTGKNRSACNHAQTGACQATFNVPSALNPNR